MRGQGSVEYLLTYAWALVVIVVVLAVFALIGLPNLRESEPERCHFAAGSVACEGFFIGIHPGGLGLAVRAGRAAMIAFLTGIAAAIFWPTVAAALGWRRAPARWGGDLMDA